MSPGDPLFAFDPVHFARVVPAIAVLPLPGWAPRLLLAFGVASAVSALDPGRVGGAPSSLWIAVAEGLLVGVIAGLPIHAWVALNGRIVVVRARVTQALGWAIFLGLSGPIGWVAGLSQWPIAGAGGAWFTTVLLLGLPIWSTELILGVIAAWVERLGGQGARRAVRLAGQPLLVLSVAALLPIALGWWEASWRALAGLSQ